jgi:hypothetical protein
MPGDTWVGDTAQAANGRSKAIEQRRNPGAADIEWDDVVIPRFKKMMAEIYGGRR